MWRWRLSPLVSCCAIHVIRRVLRRELRCWRNFSALSVPWTQAYASPLRQKRPLSQTNLRGTGRCRYRPVGSDLRQSFSGDWVGNPPHTDVLRHNLPSRPSSQVSREAEQHGLMPDESTQSVGVRVMKCLEIAWVPHK